jgi:hypothetical protein
MTSEIFETIDGYRVCWLSDEVRSIVLARLLKGDFDGIGINPYNRWSGDLGELLSERLGAKALVVPFGDRIGFTGDLLEKQSGLEMLLLSGFSGTARIDNISLKVLRILYNPSMEVGKLPSLKTLYIREPSILFMKHIYDAAPNLQRLELNSGPIKSLHGCKMLRSLMHIELSNLRKLNSISELAEVPHLNSLIIESSKVITDLHNTLGVMNSLRVLRLIDCGTIEDFSFLDSLNLEEFRCTRTKVLQPDHPALARINTVFID